MEKPASPCKSHFPRTSLLPAIAEVSYLQNNFNRRRMDSYQITIPNLNGPSPLALRVIGATKLTYDTKGRLGSVASSDKGTPPNPGGVKVNNSPVTAGETQGSFFAKEFQTANTATPFIIPLTLEEPPSPKKGLGKIYVPKNEVVPTYQNGNLTNDGRWNYTWSANNRLQRMAPTTQAIAANTAAGAPQVLPTLDFLYDWRGRRISKKVSRSTGFIVTSTTTSFIYDGWNIIATIERNSSNKIHTIVRPIWGLDLSGSLQGAGGVGALLATRTTQVTESNGTQTTTETAQHLPSQDGNGNIITWTKSTGQKTTTRDFDAFGNIVTNQGERWTPSTSFGFSTKYEDVESGLLYYGYRSYDPVTGRWLSRDPIEERGGINLYGMVENNLVGLTDYLGMEITVSSLTCSCIALTDRKVSGTGILYHYALERRENCPKEKFKMVNIRSWRQQHPQSKAIDKIELLNTAGASARARKNAFVPLPDDLVAGAWYDLKGLRGIAVINYGVNAGSVSERMVNIFDETDGDIETKWKNIKTNASNYEYAEQGISGRRTTIADIKFSRFPQSMYSATQNNSNTFVREMQRSAGLGVMELPSSHPGNKRAVGSSYYWWYNKVRINK